MSLTTPHLGYLRFRFVGGSKHNKFLRVPIHHACVEFPIIPDFEGKMSWDKFIAPLAKEYYRREMFVTDRKTYWYQFIHESIPQSQLDQYA